MEDPLLAGGTEIYTSDTSPVAASTPVTPPVELVLVPFNRRPYILISVIFIIVIVIIIVLLVIMYLGNSGIFGGAYTRPPPSDSGLIPITGTQVTLTAAERATLAAKVAAGLANITAKQQAAIAAGPVG